MLFFDLMLFFDKTFHLWFFWDQISTLTCDFWVHRAGSQLKKCLKVRQKLGTRRNLKFWKFKFKFQKLKWLKLILGTCWTTFVFMSMLKSHCLLPKIAMLFFGPHPHHPILTLSHSHPLSLSLFLTLTLFQSLIQSLSTCLTTFVLISMLKSRCL